MIIDGGKVYRVYATSEDKQGRQIRSWRMVIEKVIEAKGFIIGNDRNRMR